MTRLETVRRVGPGYRVLRLVLGIAGALAALSGHAAPDVGDPAPEFSLTGSDGRTYALSDLRGSWVVLAFFPKAFTGG